MNAPKTTFCIGVVINTYQTPEMTSKKTGEVYRKPENRVQVTTEIPQADGTVKMELADYKLSPEHVPVFNSMVGKVALFAIAMYQMKDDGGSLRPAGFFIQKSFLPREFFGFADAPTASSASKQSQPESKVSSPLSKAA